MGLKGTKQMYDLAKARATEQDIKKIRTESGEGYLIGYALFASDCKQLFYQHGFTRDSTIKHYVDLWKKCGWIVSGINGTIFFRLSFDDADETLLTRLDAEKTKISEQGLDDCIFVGASA